MALAPEFEVYEACSSLLWFGSNISSEKVILGKDMLSEDLLSFLILTAKDVESTLVLGVTKYYSKSFDDLSSRLQGKMCLKEGITLKTL